MLTWFTEAPARWMVLGLFFSTLAFAQIAATGAISGIVADPHGRPIPGAEVSVIHNDFRWKRVLFTDDRGSFSTAAVPAGDYTLQVKAAGFELKKPPRVTVNVGSSVTLTLRLTVAGASQSVTVTSQGTTIEGNTVPPAVNKQEVAGRNLFAGLTVTYLPNRDRDFSQFGQLTAGTLQDAGSSGLIIAGQRTVDSTTEVDGANFNDPLQGGPRGARDNAMFFPQTVVKEFEVVQSGAGADVGGTNAGYLNVQTKEGSNKLHGEGFYIGRPPVLASDDAFGRSVDNLQNEFGGSIGGPIRKNRAFFYAGFEQDFLHTSYWTAFQQQAPGIVIPQALAYLQTRTVEKNDPTAIFGRTDFIVNSNNTLNVEFVYNRLNATGRGEGLARVDSAPTQTGTLDGDSYWLRGSLSTLLGNTVVNQVLLQAWRDRRDTTPEDTSPEIVINGFGVLGGNGLYPSRYVSNVFQASDDVALSLGGNTIHMGAQFAYDPATAEQEANLNGRFDFDSLADYLAVSPRRYQQTFITGDATYREAIRTFGLYVNGKFRVTDQLSLSAGIRWDGQWNPQPPSANVVIPTRVPNDLNQWQPRLGLAWNPVSATVIRLSAGIYDAFTPATTFQRAFTDNGANVVTADSYFDPQILTDAVAGGLHAFPSPPAGLTVPAALVVGVAPDFHNPRSFQVSGGVEQQINSKLSVSARFVRNSTWNLQRRLNLNLDPPLTSSALNPIFPLTRPDSSIGQLLVNESNAHSSYNGLLVGASVQLPHRGLLTMNYTLSSTRDDDSNLGPFSRDTALNPFNLSSEGAYSSFDARHNFNLTSIVNLPYGFKVNTTLLARSGVPYTPIIGFDTQNDFNDWNDRAVLNGRLASRNPFRQPALVNLDLRFVKDFTLPGEGHHLDLFLDIFNVTGANNFGFGPEAVSVYGTTASPIFTAGQPLYAPDTNRFGGARQVQFTARIVAF